jgi:hypothetical protein
MSASILFSRDGMRQEVYHEQKNPLTLYTMDCIQNGNALLRLPSLKPAYPS